MNDKSEKNAGNLLLAVSNVYVWVFFRKSSHEYYNNLRWSCIVTQLSKERVERKREKFQCRWFPLKNSPSDCVRTGCDMEQFLSYGLNRKYVTWYSLRISRAKRIRSKFHEPAKMCVKNDKVNRKGKVPAISRFAVVNVDVCFFPLEFTCILRQPPDIERRKLTYEFSFEHSRLRYYRYLSLSIKLTKIRVFHFPI